MAGPNPNNISDPDNLLLGRGIIYVANIDPTTGKPDTDGWRDLGNAPSFTVTLSKEDLTHKSSRTGISVIDKIVAISQECRVAFTIDELTHENLTLFFLGTQSDAVTNAAVAGFAEYEMISDVKLGRWYDLVDSNGVRAYNIDSTDLTVEKQGEPDVACVLGTDYEVDTRMGRIRFLPGASNIANGDPCDVTLAAEAGALGVDEVKGLTTTNKRVALKFISENPADDDRKAEYQFHQVNLAPEGDFGLISDEFATMGFSGVAEKNVLADADSPFVTVRTPKIA